MRGRMKSWGLGPLMLVVALFATACSSASAGQGGSAPSVHIVSPANGAKVSEPFTLKVDASVPLGDPSTGEDHVHLCFDGQSCDTEYTLVYGNSIPVRGLTPGTHTIEASLRNADHSAAGATDSITLTISGTGSSAGAATSGGPTASASGSGGRGYGY